VFCKRREIENSLEERFMSRKRNQERRLYGPSEMEFSVGLIIYNFFGLEIFHIDMLMF